VIPDPIGEAVEWVRSGGLLAYPTETVWGLGADAGSDAALGRLRAWKGRGEETAISILVEGAGALAGLGFEFGASARRLAQAFWPGPLTLVLRCRRRFAPGVARGDGAVGVRCSAHPLAAALARRLAREGAGPITATSLNRSGAPPSATRDEARAACGEGPDAPHMIEVERAEAGGEAPSTVLDLTSPEPQVLRWGSVAAQELEPVLQEIAAA
jgi:L-threonylcarbamoyladenylate synthase